MGKNNSQKIDYLSKPKELNGIGVHNIENKLVKIHSRHFVNSIKNSKEWSISSLCCQLKHKNSPIDYNYIINRFIKAKYFDRKGITQKSNTQGKLIEHVWTHLNGTINPTDQIDETTSLKYIVKIADTDINKVTNKTIETYLIKKHTKNKNLVNLQISNNIFNKIINTKMQALTWKIINNAIIDGRRAKH